MNLIRIIFQKLGIYYKLGNLYFKYWVIPKYLKIEERNRKRFLQLQSNNPSILNKTKALEVVNQMSNSGGIPIEIEKFEINDVKSNVIKNESRKTDIENYDGMALNDAVAIESWKHFSFYDLAYTVSEIAKKVTKKDSLTILEMGCGAGSMFEYFKHLGTSLYIGLEGNPLAFKYSPIISSNLEFFRLVNLQEEINFGAPFDLIYTSEVLEHIREDKTDFFIKTIANHMSPNSVFIGTIATTIMDVHINIHSKSWWLDKFKKYDMVPVVNSNELESKIASSNPYNWNKNTSHIFVMQKSTKA